MPIIRPVSNAVCASIRKRSHKMPLPTEMMPGQRADAMSKKAWKKEIWDDDDDWGLSTKDDGDGWTFCGDVSLGCIPLLSF